MQGESSRITRYKGAEFPACHGVSMLEEYGLGWGRGMGNSMDTGPSWNSGLIFDGTLGSWYCMWCRAPA